MKKSFFSFNFLFASLLTLLFFLPKIAVGKVPIPADSLLGLYHPWRDNAYDGFNPYKFPTKNPLITDPVLQIYPWRKLVVENFKEGNLPLWNPYSFSGQPLLANVQSAPFQVLNLLFFIFGEKLAWSILVILPPTLTSLFMYLFLTSLKLKEISSIFAAFVLPFTGFFVSWFTWGTVITAAMWLPLILFCINKIFEKISPFYFILLIFAISQTIFSGHWQTAFYVIFASLLYFLFVFFKKRLKLPTLLIVISIFLAVLIASIQLLPSLEFTSLSARQFDQGYSPARTDWFLPSQNLTQLLAPDFFGNPASYNYWGIWNYAEFVSFIGILPLFFALLALIKRGANTTFFIVLAALSLLFALNNPISKLPYVLNLPFISSAQPSRIIFLLVFALTCLSAFGLEAFLAEKSKKKLVLPSLFIILLICALAFFTYLGRDFLPKVQDLNPVRIALRNLILPFLLSLALLSIIFLRIIKTPKKLLIALIFILTIFDLFRFANKSTPFAKISDIFPQTSTTNFLQSTSRPFRIMSTDRRIFNGNTSSVYNIEQVSGYDPLYLKSYAQLVTAWQSGKVTSPGSFNRIITPEDFSLPITDFLNIKYIVTFDEISKPEFTKVFEEGQTKIFENNNVLPRAFIVDRVVKTQDESDELAKIIDPGFDPQTTAFSQDFEYTVQNNKSEVQIKNYQDQSIQLETTSEKAAPLVLSNVYYPGWNVFIDSQKAQLLKVNYIFQSVLVPAGTHKVEFKFQPQSFYNGLYLSAAGIVLTIIFLFLLWKTKFQS